MVAYKNSPSTRSNRVPEEYNPSFVATGVQDNITGKHRKSLPGYRNKEESIDDLIHLKNGGHSASEANIINTANHRYSYSPDSGATQVTNQREYHRKTTDRYGIKMSNLDFKENYDLLQPVWFEKIMQKIEENRAKEKKPSGKGQSYISLN